MSFFQRWFPCPAICWLLFSLLGAGLLMLLMSAGLGFGWALILVVIAVVLAARYVMPMICSGVEMHTDTVFDGNVPAPPAQQTAETSVAETDDEGAEGEATPMDEPEMASQPVMAEPEARAAPAAQPMAAMSQDEKNGSDDEVAQSASQAAPSSSAAAPVEASAGDDDLTRIKGIGKGLEASLKQNGVTSFAQIAAWGPEQIHWADYDLAKFKGRCTRDDWVGQAKVLASGGTTEFASRVDQGEVYE